MSPAQVKAHVGESPYDLRAARCRSGLSLRAASRQVGISADALRRYEAQERRPPTAVVRNLSALYEQPSPAELVRRRVGDGGATVPELLRELGDLRERRALRALLDERSLLRFPVDRTDRRGRVCVRAGVFPGPNPSGLDRMAPPLRSGRDLASARRSLGLSDEDMARRVGVARSTYRGWEARTAPRGRLRQLAAALEVAPSGDQLRRIRDEAGWSLRQVGARVGVTLGVVHAWEAGKRPIPPGRKASLLAACAEMQAQAGSRLRDRTNRIVSLVRAEPGISLAAVRHRNRIKQNGRQIFDPLTDRAIRTARREGRVVVIQGIELDRLQRPKASRRLYPPDLAPRHDQTPSRRLTGNDLRRERNERGLIQVELGRRLGMTQGWVCYQERRGSKRLSPYWEGRVWEVLDELKAEPSADDRLRKAIVDKVAAEPGMPPWRLTQVVGWRTAVKRLRDALVTSGELAWGTGWDACGRPHPGLYRPADLVAAAERPQIHPVALRRRRRKAGLSSAQLGERVGVRGNTVTRWETGIRRIPPNRVPRILEALPPESDSRVSPYGS